MKKKYSFTNHGFARLVERSDESVNSIIEYIENEKYELVGIESNSNRKHVLIFSICDQNWHVIVYDQKTLQIITILPVDYYESLAWRIPYEALNKIKAISTGEEQVIVEKEIIFTVVKILCYINGKFIKLGTWKMGEGISVDTFKPNKEFWNYVKSQIKNKKVSLSRIKRIFIRKNDKDEPKPINTSFGKNDKELLLKWKL